MEQTTGLFLGDTEQLDDMLPFNSTAVGRDCFENQGFVSHRVDSVSAHIAGWNAELAVDGRTQVVDSPPALTLSFDETTFDEPFQNLSAVLDIMAKAGYEAGRRGESPPKG